MEVTLCFGVNPMLILLFNIKRDKSKVESFPKNPPVLTQSDLHRLFNKAQGSLKRTDDAMAAGLSDSIKLLILIET